MGARTGVTATDPADLPVFMPWPAPSPPLVFGLPGEWAGLDGRPRAAPPVARIGVVLPGPAAAALAAEPALAVLRRGFAEARIVLLAEAATAAAALHFGLADDALGPDDAPPAPFDLLLDLGAGALALPDAPVIAGLGSAPHLAIAVPAPPGSLAPVEVAGLAGQWLGRAERRRALGLTLEAEGAHSPASAGLGDDERVLGFALLAVRLEDLGTPQAAPLDWQAEAVGPLLAQGWHPVEAMGAWSDGDLGTLAVPLDDAAIGPFRVTLRLRGHVHAAAPEAFGVLRAEGARPVPLMSAEPASEIAAVLEIPPAVPVLAASAEVAVAAPAGFFGREARLTLVVVAESEAACALHARLRGADGRALLAEARWSGRVAGRMTLALDLALDTTLAALPQTALIVDLALEAPPTCPLRLERAWLGLPEPATARQDAAQAAAWAALAARCVALLAPGRPGQARADARRAPPPLVAARDAGRVVVAVLAGDGHGPVGNGGWDRVAAALAARPGVHLWRPAPGITTQDLAASMAAVDVAVGPAGLVMRLAARMGLAGLVVLGPGEAAPDPSGLGWVRHGGGDGMVPAADVVALLAPEIEVVRQRRN